MDPYGEHDPGQERREDPRSTTETLPIRDGGGQPPPRQEEPPQQRPTKPDGKNRNRQPRKRGR